MRIQFDKRLWIKATIELKNPLDNAGQVITSENHLELFHPFIVSHFGTVIVYWR